MFIPEKLKLNKFRHVAIPSAKDIFSRYGQRVTPTSDYTGDELAPMPQTKIDSIREADADYSKFLSEPEHVDE